MEKKEGLPEDVLKFYSIAKKHTVQAFTSSQPYLVDIRKYKIIPGSNFRGCVPLSKASS